MDSKNVQPSIIKSAGVMGFATMISRVLGLVREQVFAHYFGAGNLTDAFNIAFRIPNLLRDLFAEGALSSAFVPTYTKVKNDRGPEAAWRVAGLVFRVLFCVVLILSILGILAAPPLVALYAKSFQQIPGKFELTVLMTRILFLFFPFIALAAAYMGILNAEGKFFVPALSSALFNAVSIVIGLWVAKMLPAYGVQPIVGMAVGVVMGAVVQAFFQLPLLYRVGYRFVGRRGINPSDDSRQEPAYVSWTREPALRSMLKLMGPSVVGQAATQVNFLVNSILATSQGPGAVSWLAYAFRLMQFPIGVFGVSIAQATLPAVSRSAAQKNDEETKRILTQSCSQVFAINLPAAAGLAFLGTPIIHLIFQHGKFSSFDTHSTHLALAGYAVGLVFYSGVKVLVPACYALGHTREAVRSSIYSVLMTIAANLILIRFSGYVGLALGTSFAAAFNFLYLSRILKPYLNASVLYKVFISQCFLSLVMGSVGLGGHYLWDYVFFNHLHFREGFWMALIKCSTLIILSLGVLVSVAKLTGQQETLAAYEFFSRKVKNKLSRFRN